MQVEKRLKNHYKRWNITSDYEEEFSKFKNRLIDVINKYLGDYLAENQDIDRHFNAIYKLDNANQPNVRKSAPFYGIDHILSLSDYASKSLLSSSYTKVSYTKVGFGDTYIYKCMSACESLQKLATVLQITFWALEIKHDEIKEASSKIAKKIKEISVLTPSASFTVYRKGKQLIVYPNGDQFLDKGIIDCTLSGLEDYPKASEAFEKALGIYLSGETGQYRNLLDNLRFSLEQLLKIVLKNQKSLEKQRDSLLPWLNKNGLHSQVVNLYMPLLNTYQTYQNDAVKHNEAFSVDEIEFMIYLTGNFMRLILQLASRTNNHHE